MNYRIHYYLNWLEIKQQLKDDYNISITTEIYNLMKKYKAKGFVEGEETMNIIASKQNIIINLPR